MKNLQFYIDDSMTLDRKNNNYQMPDNLNETKSK